jgi:hypothetical protein
MNYFLLHRFFQNRLAEELSRKSIQQLQFPGKSSFQKTHNLFLKLSLQLQKIGQSAQKKPFSTAKFY